MHTSRFGIAFWATLHCLTGCALGEVAGMSLGTALGWPAAWTLALSIGLAFAFGYSLTLVPMLRAGLGLRAALALALAADTVSIATMELTDSLVMLAIPGAMAAGPTTWLFWGSMFLSLFIAGVAAFPVNLWLFSKGRGHAVVHGPHHGASHGAAEPHRLVRSRHAEKVRAQVLQARVRHQRHDGAAPTLSLCDV